MKRAAAIFLFRLQDVPFYSQFPCNGRACAMLSASARQCYSRGIFAGYILSYFTDCSHVCFELFSCCLACSGIPLLRLIEYFFFQYTISDVTKGAILWFHSQPLRNPSTRERCSRLRRVCLKTPRFLSFNICHAGVGSVVAQDDIVISVETDKVALVAHLILI